MSDKKSAISYFIGMKVIHEIPRMLIGKSVVREAERREVILMAVADGYAMVRRPKCAPYVCSVKVLEAE